MIDAKAIFRTVLINNSAHKRLFSYEYLPCYLVLKCKFLKRLCLLSLVFCNIDVSNPLGTIVQAEIALNT